MQGLGRPTPVLAVLHKIKKRKGQMVVHAPKAWKRIFVKPNLAFLPPVAYSGRRGKRWEPSTLCETVAEPRPGGVR